MFSLLLSNLLDVNEMNLEFSDVGAILSLYREKWHLKYWIVWKHYFKKKKKQLHFYA